MGTTLKDIAARTGIHPTVISAVLNNRRYLRVSEERREYIRQVAKEMGYFPNVQAVSLRKKQKPIVGVFLPSWDDLLLLELIHGLTEGSALYNIPLSFHFGMTADSYSAFIDSMTSFQHTGIISYVPYWDKGFEKTLCKLDEYLINGGKVIALNTLNWPMKKSVTLAMDDECGGWMAGRYLAEKKLSFYAVLSVESVDSVYSLREKTFSESCESFDPGKIVKVYRAKNVLSPEKVIGKMLDVCSKFALPVLLECQKRNLIYGKDFYIVRYDKCPDSEDTFRLPVIIQPFHQLGVLAIKKLRSLLAGDVVESEKLKPILKYPGEK